MQQTPPDFVVDPIGYIQFYFNLYAPYILLFLALFVLVVLYFIVTRLAKRSLIRIGMGQEATTGIVLILRLVFFIAAVMLLVSYFEANYAAILSASAIFGTALGLAFSTALSNIVSGLYVLAARPFRVGDYVRIGDVEGIVREITLNYTRVLLSDESRQLVPNSKVVTSQVTNFRIDLSEYVKQKEEEAALKAERDHSYRETLDDAWRQLRMLTKNEEAYRYTFDLNIHMNQDMAKTMETFDQVCDKWSHVFLTRPTYMVWAKPTAAITIRFAFIVSDPMIIVKRSSDFMRDLLQDYYESEAP
ncbi:MAG: mechanosensitive ion channel [Candidatus Thorarchaeota archaeon]|nr:MAG: mechanosensitive ion channel [Candidatus Thorarchaeota archaeon]